MRAWAWPEESRRSFDGPGGFFHHQHNTFVRLQSRAPIPMVQQTSTLRKHNKFPQKSRADKTSSQPILYIFNESRPSSLNPTLADPWASVSGFAGSATKPPPLVFYRRSPCYRRQYYYCCRRQRSRAPPRRRRVRRRRTKTPVVSRRRRSYRRCPATGKTAAGHQRE